MAEDSEQWSEPFEDTDFTLTELNSIIHDDPTSVSPSPPLARIGLNTDKAGMEGLDKSKINQIIVEASKGSKYYKKEIEREKLLSQRIDKMLLQLKQFNRAEILKAEKEADAELHQLTANRNLSRVIVHIDMDAFYAAVEMRDDHTLRDVPMAVGGESMLVSCIAWAFENYFVLYF